MNSRSKTMVFMQAKSESEENGHAFHSDRNDDHNIDPRQGRLFPDIEVREYSVYVFGKTKAAANGNRAIHPVQQVQAEQVWQKRKIYDHEKKARRAAKFLLRSGRYDRVEVKEKLCDTNGQHCQGRTVAIYCLKTDPLFRMIAKFKIPVLAAVIAGASAIGLCWAVAAALS